MTKIFWPPCARCVFSRSLLRCPVIELVLSEEYVTTLPQSNENASLTSLHTSCICCAVEPMLIFGMPSNDVAISPESLSNILLKRSKIYHLHHCFIFITGSQLLQLAHELSSCDHIDICSL